MKNKLPVIVTTAILAALSPAATADIMEQGHYRVATQGRAGYTVMPVTQAEVQAQQRRQETTVALVMDAPTEPSTNVLTAGRSGFIYLPNR